ncbi:MAG: ATP-binding protein [Chitinophagaceae bacterium]|nr:MAG: ATP-binding protein [Chitinophagaceae bacterium]
MRCELSQVPSIRADRERILQVITNFLTNAAKYAPQSEEVVVRTEDLSDRIKVSVQDFGNGVPLDAQPHLFDRYYRTTDAAREDGFGLGLYISSRIIEQHFGEIGVISVPGQGATFFFTLPYT